ncbi:hypothetical protein ACSFCX_24140 [Yokenella regensburgei]
MIFPFIKKSASFLTLRNGDTWMMRIRRNVAFFAVRLLVPDLAPSGLAKSVIVLNLDLEDTLSFLEHDERRAEASCREHEPPGKSLLYRY